MPGMTPRSIQLPVTHGLSLRALEWSSDGVPLLFLHGFGNDSHVWDAAAPLVAPHYRTLALDQRGHGDSDCDSEMRYDHASMAGDVLAVCELLDLERIVIVGHSMGGRVAMHFAGAHPERMAGLVIVDSGPELDTRGTTRIRMESESAELVFNSVQEYERILIELYPAAPVATMTALARHWLRERPDGRFEPKLDPNFRRWRADGVSEDELRARMKADGEALWKALETIPCPTLVIRGAASDVLSAETADRMVDDVLQNGTLSVVARASHSVMLDNPEAFNESLCNFVLG
jgi:pimeloyl-ACP methyl ester carboxylesterase